MIILLLLFLLLLVIATLVTVLWGKVVQVQLTHTKVLTLDLNSGARGKKGMLLGS